MLPTLIGYLIRRFYYPSKYFKDPSFFIFENTNKINENKIKTKIDDFLSSPTKNEELLFLKLMLIINDINQMKNEETDKIKIRDFHEDDFVILRTLNTRKNTFFYFVIHLDSFYTFMMKKIVNSDKNEREINFCQNYHHRCMTQFYGFLKEKENIIGFLYEYQSNGPFSIHHTTSEIYSLTTIIRLFNSIEYLQSKELIHRDLKPYNILINHDNVPFVSDFDTIRSIKNEKTNEPEKEFTQDIGSILYSSPEQDESNIISYSTDIYSFGLIIYYLFEKNICGEIHIYIKKKNAFNQ